MGYDRITCPKCSKDFGQEVKFLQHLVEEHQITDALAFYVEVNCNGEHPRCGCSQDCQNLITWSGWKKGFTSKYARGHNAKSDSIFLDHFRQKDMAKKRKEGHENGSYSVWNKGLNKETSSKVFLMSEKTANTLRDGYSSGRIKDWRESDPEKAKKARVKISKTKKEKFENGEMKVWNKGLSKSNNSSLLSASKKISERYKSPNAGRRLKIEELRNRIQVFSGQFSLLSNLEEYKTRRIDRLLFSCNVCGMQQLKSLAMLEESPVCFSCSPRESRGQLEIFNFVKSLVSDAVLSDRSIIHPKELDIWIPSKKLGIEYNGLYWHSAANIDDIEYHTKKLFACRFAGVDLFSIYEDEWRDKRSIVEGMIQHRLGIFTEKLDARKLQVVSISSHEAKKFFDENHLEGHVVGSKYLALIKPTSKEIVAAISLRKPFHKKYENCLELGRCCAKIGFSVRGWLGKLTSAAKNHAKNLGVNKLITYVDLRVGAGSGYQAAGWHLFEVGKIPRFWWTDYSVRYNRFKFRADSKAGMSQKQVAVAAGVSKIHGMPNSLYVTMTN